MPTAFVLVNIEIGHDEEVLKALNTIMGVKEAYITYGVYDIIAKIQTDTDEQLKNIINRKLAILEHVRATLTIITLDPK